MLTPKQQELLLYIRDSLQGGSVSPSFEEMKVALGLKSKSGIHRLIAALEERGFIRRLPNRARALEILRLPAHLADAPPRVAPKASNDDVIEIPLHGRVAAGVPIEAMERATTLAVPAALLGMGEHYAIEISGDSMIEAGILDGDFALIKRTDVARDGEIVVALIDDSEATLKYLRREGRMIRLDPANRAYDPQRYMPNQVKIQGRLAGILRRYN